MFTKKSLKQKNVMHGIVFSFFAISAFFCVRAENAQAANGTLSLVPSVSSVISGGSFYVDVNMDTNLNTVVATRAVIRYDKTKVTFVNWNTATSIFTTNNNLCYAADGGVEKPINSPCQIIANDTANGIVTITMASAHVADPVVDISKLVKGSGLLVARANFTANVDIASNLINVMGLHHANTRNGNDSGIVIDDNLGTDITDAPVQRSTVQYGDLNSDRRVNLFDYNTLLPNYGNTTPGNVADITADNLVNLFDYNVILGSFGQTF